MTQEEFYIWLLNYNSSSEIKLPEFNPEFLKNYEIAKLFLGKIGINNLSEIQQRNLNLEAVSSRFRVSEYITLQYDIPEILELLPEKIRGFLNLKDSQIQSLPQLKSVRFGLDLQNTKIQFLPELRSVGMFLDLRNSQIQSLPQLESVGGDLYLRNSKIQSLPKLESVVESLNLSNSEIKFLPELESVGGPIYIDKYRYNYWKHYFNETGRPHLATRVTG